MADSKFDYHDIVFISSAKKNLEFFNGREGVIRGISDNENDITKFAYSVDILNESSEVEVCKFIFEEDLLPTGKKADPNDLYSGESIKVRVDPETGEGELVEDDDV